MNFDYINNNKITIQFKLIIIIALIYIIFNYKEWKKDIEKKLLNFIKYNKQEININNTEDHLNSIGKYINLIYNKQFEIINYNSYIINPKISFVSPVFNKSKYLEPLIISIQHQLLEEFEIIFIDDYSTDDSVKIINNFSSIDKRIKLIKNKRNKGTLYSRCQGSLKSLGEYIIFIDSDDLLLKDGLFNSYNYIKKKDLSIIQFNTIIKRNDNITFNSRYYYKKIIRQPLLSYIFYYNESTYMGDELNTVLWDKLIDRKTTINAVNYIGKDYYNKYIQIENDVILLFSIFHEAISYQYINEIGYFYFRNNNDSITNSWKDYKLANSIVHGIFININFLYDKTGNTTLDKLFCVFKLQQSFKRYTFSLINAKKEYPFIRNILYKLSSSPYINKTNKMLVIIIFRSLSLFYKLVAKKT